MGLHGRSVRQDVRELGDLLGEAVERHASRDAFEAVEDARTAAIDYRQGETSTRDELRSVLAENDEEVNASVARAFTTYFELVNLAEERERVRSLREGEDDGTLADSLPAAVERLADDGAAPSDVRDVLEAVRVVPTFTAHPTEARRKTVKATLVRVTDLLEELDQHRLTKRERANKLARLDALVESLWTTKQVRGRRPEPFDEARNVHWYLANVIFDQVPEMYDRLEDALEEHYEEPPAVPEILDFRSWAGSDRDGNPFVTPEVTTKTLERQRDLVVENYRDALDDVSGVLSQDATRMDLASVEASLDRDAERVPSLVSGARERYPDEPLRQKVLVMWRRLGRITDVRPGGYDDYEEFLADIDVVEDALRANDADRIADEYIDPLERQVRTFRFHLASLDLRDHQEMHTGALEEALEREGVDYRSMDEDERVEFLTEATLQTENVLDLTDTEDLSDEAARVLSRFDALGGWHEEYGEEAIDTYCISMTERPSHVLEVLFLADQAGVVDLPEHCGLDVVPLLETESALANARETMETLFDNDAYGAALEARGTVQEVMLGYSDSNKENGFLAANWALNEAQRKLAAITDDLGVELRLFHGRGGSISRGGGPMNEALLALPPETVTGEVKFTQQGESIAETYGNPYIAERNLEQMLNAQIRARHDAVSRGDSDALDDPGSAIDPEWEAAMETMASAARSAYVDLLGTEGFVQYFEQATPITVIEELNMGSRPASRSEERSVEDLRAIPWVFSWTQSRCIVPGWFGVGTGIEAYLDDGGDVETLREMYAEWPFFRTMLDRASMALARTEMEIAAEYADLADDDLRERIFPTIESEYGRSRDAVLDITEADALITREWLTESLERRNPYVDPLNLLQVDLLRQSHRTEAAEQTLRLSVKGIAAGMKNTG
ncbi:phosphoenolpyruvate carboxylase [Halarchaeum sp. CBA1220]|uniref:phosphoenolpyruvate carboxylase n=1 Tax=Halarchaeum sp. CBA1220 TaxID=1853682 RepID=UPI000F3A9367|nr:phosphoenolpyruvate carboxylase [Halarchaeum sp. CBA1220]QLC33970.1 phosphoenolpyruvate carboxylase [Halarchaeum sp. CBA1220]